MLAPGRCGSIDAWLADVPEACHTLGKRLHISESWPGRDVQWGELFGGLSPRLRDTGASIVWF